MAVTGRRARRVPDIWPGFVDALSTLLMVIIFVLMVFMLAQFYLTQTLSGRERTLEKLNRQIAELAELLSLERQSNADLRLNMSQLSAELQSSSATREKLAAELAVREDAVRRLGAMTDRAGALALDLEAAQKTIGADKEQIRLQLRQVAQLEHDIQALQALRDELEAKVRELGAKVGEQGGQLAEERKLSDEARAHAALLNRQLQAVREELARLAAALDASENLATQQKVEIANLGSRLNQALASKVEELQRYRSEFFGRLRQVLGNRPGIRVEGDRFVFQSELLFETASADIGAEGRVQVADVARTLLEVAKEFPEGINWVLRVDGHTDRVPIHNPAFPSNWELSQARALSVVKLLIAQGLPPERLAAVGFGEFQPLDPGAAPDALRRNRRIELRLDQR